MTKKALIKIIESILADEDDAEQQYSRLRDQIKIPEAQDLLKEIVHDERKHQRYLIEILSLLED